MPIEVKDIVTHLFDKEEQFESLDQFKEKLNQKFVSREIAADDEEIKNKVTGKVLGTIETKLKREFGLTEQEVSGKKVSELVELAGQKNKAKIEEFESYSYPEDKDGKVDEKPLKENDDAMDALRYIIMSQVDSESRNGSGPRISYGISGASNTRVNINKIKTLQSN